MIPPPGDALTRNILDECDRLGFALSGVCAAERSSREREFKDWLSAGRHGEMTWLARRVEERLDPRAFMPWCRSLVMVADLYAARGTMGPPDAAARDADPSPADAPPAEARGRLARYAQGRDYHVVIKKRLHRLCDRLRTRIPGERFKAFVDISPVLEREHAVRAGLGWIGKHTLLIHPRLGSALLLGGVATSLDLPPPPMQGAIADHCGTCTRCIDACPTNAITPYSVDATRCISYLTIERRSPIAAEFHGRIGDWLFGCDVCQEVCPHNSPRAPGPGPGQDATHVHPDYHPRHSGLRLLDVLGWSEDARRRQFAGSALRRATLAMMKRNALIVAGNRLRRHDDDALRRRIEAIAADAREPDLVRATARDVLAGISAARRGPLPA